MSTVTAIRAKLADIEGATVNDARRQVRASLTINEDGATVLIVGGSPDEYQQQKSRLRDLEVDHHGLVVMITIRTRLGESVGDLLDRALDFVSTEMPVPA